MAISLLRLAAGVRVVLSRPRRWPRRCFGPRAPLAAAPNCPRPAPTCLAAANGKTARSCARHGAGGCASPPSRRSFLATLCGRDPPPSSSATPAVARRAALRSTHRPLRCRVGLHDLSDCARAAHTPRSCACRQKRAQPRDRGRDLGAQLPLTVTDASPR